MKVGHAQDLEARTGCTVVLAPPGAMGGISVRGGAPATRELHLLRIDGITREIHAVLLTGGSAFGLDATGGVLSWLEDQGIGFDAGVAKVPLVPTLSLFDLAVGKADVRPDAEMARRACEAASGGPVAEGPVGVAAGATVGKALGMEHCSPSGIGTAFAEVAGVSLGVIAVSNAFGDLVDSNGNIAAGAMDPENPDRFLDTERYLREHGLPEGDPFSNCTFAVLATSAHLDRGMANRLAEMAMVGISRTVRPAHTMFDFDAVIALSCGKDHLDITALGGTAGELLREALIRGVRAAKSTRS